MTTVSDEIIAARLRAIDSCTVSDALDALGLPAGITGLQRLSTTQRVAGRVMTVRLAVGAAAPGHRSHLGTAAIECAERGNVIVVEHPGIDAAGWGGVLSLGARLKDIAAVIVDGPARDIDEALAMGFPVFARCATPRTARGRVHEQEYNCAVTIGGVPVRPGDFVIADGSGAAFIPQARLDEIVSAAERIAEKERLMSAELRRGGRITQVMGMTYETMLEGSGRS
jgi:4-hydroxy-4-methyl-2-oxoglutarate aldolase